MKRKFAYWQAIALIVVFGFLGGCGATSQPSKFYVLNALSPSNQDIGKAPENLAIGIGPITIPEYVDRPQIVTRISDHELNLAEFHKWAEPLKDNIPQVLADNLSVLMNTDQVATYPWKRNTSIDYQVTIDITRLDTAPDGKAHLMARWHIFGEDTRTVLGNKKSHFKTAVQGTDYSAIVSALNHTIGGLSRAVAHSITAVHTKGNEAK